MVTAERTYTLTNIPLHLGPVGNLAQMDLANASLRAPDSWLYTFHLAQDPERFANAVSWQTRGQVSLNAPSYQSLGPLLAAVAHLPQILNYDLEGWEQSNGEWGDIGGSTAAMRRLADGYGLTLAGVLSARLAGAAGAIEAMVSHLDMYGAQAHPLILRDGLERYQAFMDESRQRAKQANPAVRFLAVLNLTAGSPAATETVDFMARNAGRLQGVALWLDGTDECTGKLKEVLAAARPQ